MKLVFIVTATTTLLSAIFLLQAESTLSFISLMVLMCAGFWGMCKTVFIMGVYFGVDEAIQHYEKSLDKHLTAKKIKENLN